MKEWYDEQKAYDILNSISGVTCPNPTDVFNAFDFFPPHNTNVVIVGQDPYPDPQHAHGLAFSSLSDKTPASLKNIFKEIDNDIGFGVECKHTNNLSHWAEQGVLLLNSCLTTQEHFAGAHKNIGWEEITDGIIKGLSEDHKGIVFLLWGNAAMKKRELINEDNHYILTAPHPSPLSAHRGFFGCSHFSLCNTFLLLEMRAPIEWTLL